MNTITYLVTQAVRNEHGQLTDMLPLMILDSEAAAEIYVTAFPHDQQAAMRIRPVEYVATLTEDHLPPRVLETVGVVVDDETNEPIGTVTIERTEDV